MDAELEQHLKMVRDELDEMEDTDAREAALNLLDALERINKNFEASRAVVGTDGKMVRGMSYSTVQLPIVMALSEVVDAPQYCQKKLSGGRAYGPTPEPDEYCENWAVPGQDYCEDHL